MKAEAAPVASPGLPEHSPRDYRAFIARKSQMGGRSGFEPLLMPDFLYGFQQALVDWSLRKGRGAIFAGCGLGKTPMHLVWAENVARKTNKPVLILTPLAVSDQTIQEGEKFGIECVRSRDGKYPANAKIVVTNYERLHYFDSSEFIGVVPDEWSVCKDFNAERTASITEFMRTIPYRLLCTATPSPNDYIELGTASEALGELGRMDMLAHFFKNDENTISIAQKNGDFWTAKWRFKKHAELHFWRWVCSWARAVRKPSDLGFEDGPFVLPPLIMRESLVKVDRPLDGKLFAMPAATLDEVRAERRLTLNERCDLVAEKVKTNEPVVVWCNLNSEGDRLERIIPDAKQISGSQSDDEKEELLRAFTSGQLRVLVSKDSITGFGLNWQHCHHMTCFPSYSYERFHQSIRRCWRFGQKHPVTVDIIASEGELGVKKTLERKSEQAERMFESLVAHMNNAVHVNRSTEFSNQERMPAWL